MVPRENKNNAYSKFGWTNKEYYGIFHFGHKGKNFFFVCHFGNVACLEITARAYVISLMQQV